MTILSFTVPQLIIAFLCTIIVYYYLSFSFHFKKEVKAWKKLHEAAQLNELISTPGTSSAKEYDLNRLLIEIKRLLDQGYWIGIDTSLFAKYSLLPEQLSHEHILMTEEITNCIRNNSKIIGMTHNSISSFLGDGHYKYVYIKESFTKTIGLDSKNTSDRAIGSYLYIEKTNLVNVKLITADAKTFEKAMQVGLRAALF